MMTPILKKSDYETIKALIEGIHPTQRTKEVGTLQSELRRAKIVEDDKISQNVIQLGSYFEVREITSKRQLCLTLTLPGEANLQEQRVSILSPLGVALIGFQKGKEFEWQLPAGKRTFIIEKVSAPSAVPTT
ncbi:GreA/GreB family elongation factor [Lunatimonas sp.]|uniref:GreA/GreB family elongation factor n=1 Tax=Lunatimonas sp. TaxID=2060141 RepID=UPI00263A3F39|nr:GreA/GreB family elongation factor [Lunatimonas sp.]